MDKTDTVKQISKKKILVNTQCDSYKSHIPLLHKFLQIMKHK